MKSVLIFGAGSTGQRVYRNLKEQYKVMCFFDNDLKKVGTKINNIMVYSPSIEKANEIGVQYIIIASVSGATQIKRQLLELGFAENMIIDIDKGYDTFTPFIQQLAEVFIEDGVKGSLAELGVYQGDTAVKINKAFPDRKLYLFDTFEGFSSKDIKTEETNSLSVAKEGWFEDTSIELVMSKMPYPENVIIYKGYFPETVKDGLEDTFCMVRLDMDLYEPTVAALDFFTPKMVRGGIIILHDYFGDHYKGIKKAVNEYLNKYCDKGLKKMPLSDISIALIGY